MTEQEEKKGSLKLTQEQEFRVKNGEKSKSITSLEWELWKKNSGGFENESMKTENERDKERTVAEGLRSMLESMYVTVSKP